MLFEPPFGGLMGNVCSPSIAHRKARGQFPIRIIELFPLSPTLVTL